MIHRRRWLRNRSLLLVFLLSLASGPVKRGFADEPPVRGGASSFRNPLKRNGADPWVIVHDGWYYLSTTTSSDIRMQRARRLGELKDAPSQVVWKDDNPSRFRDMWAPEFHRFDGEDGPHWY